MDVWYSPKNKNDGDHDEHNRTDDQYKVKDLPLKGGHARFGFVRQFCNSSKNCAIARGDNDSSAGARYAVCSLKADVLGLEIIRVRGVDHGSQRKRFTCTKLEHQCLFYNYR